MSEVGDKTVWNVDGKDVSLDEARSDARKERMNQVTRLTFLLNIKKVGENTCYDAVNLTVVHLPEGITHIRYAAFSCCSNLSGIKFPKLLTSIGESFFFYCSNLGEVDLRDTITLTFKN